MKNSTYTELIAAYFNHSMSSEQKARFEELVAEGKIDILEIKEMENIYQAMDKLPAGEPSGSVRDSFYAMLEAEKENARPVGSPFFEWLNERFTPRKMTRLGFAVCLFLIGMFVGN